MSGDAPEDRGGKTPQIGASADGSDARAAILARIREAVRGAPAAEEPVRGYRTSGDMPRPDMLDLMVERLEDYRVIPHRCAPNELPATIREILAARDAGRVVVPWDLEPAWTRDAEGVAWLRDESLSNDTLDRADGVLTTCAVAIAETGSIVLDGGPGQGRRAITLLPDYHLCIVPADRVVQTVPEGVRRLGDAVRAGRPLTMVSGPSATSDIELNRVEGVHGPRTLEVVLVDSRGGSGASTPPPGGEAA